MKRRIMALLLLWMPVAAFGDDDREHRFDQAAPVERILAEIAATYPQARLLSVKLDDDEDGHPPWYVVKLLTSDGRVVKLYYRARDLKLLEEKKGSRHREE